MRSLAQLGGGVMDSLQQHEQTIASARCATAADDTESTQDDPAPIWRGVLNALPFALLFWGVFLKALGVW